MNVGTLLNSKAAQIGVGVLVAAVVGYVIVKRLGDATDKALDDFNAGTPYASNNNNVASSAVLALGNATNQTLGGAPASIGETVADWWYDLWHESTDATQARLRAEAGLPPQTPTYQPRKGQVRGAL